MEYTVHYRLSGDPTGKTNLRLCETQDKALNAARELVDRGGRIAFITRGTDVWLTGDQVAARLEK